MVIKHRLYWTLQIGGWVFYSVLQILFSMLATGSVSPRRIIFFVVEALLCLTITHAYRVVVVRDKWLRLSMPRLIPRVLLGASAMGLILYSLRIPVGIALGSFDATLVFDFAQIAGLTFFYAVIFFLWSVFYFTYHYFERYNTTLKMEASMIEIELNNLRSQLNPHFIFNSLNSIRALIDENPTKSKQAINQLSNLLRISLAPDKHGLTNFDDELKLVKDYLGLEVIRFEERLKTEFVIHPESNRFLIPPLMLQTLVENGIKHGISKLKAGGTIQVITFVDESSLKIHIRNSGHVVNGIKKGKEGLGIKNTIQRLKLIYGEKATFRIANENDNFVLTEIVIPQINML